MSTLAPATAEEVLEAVRWAAGEVVPLEIVGQGSKRGIGHPVQAGYTLALAGLSGVTLYEPEELVLAARAGTPLAEVEALLAEHGQQFAFEPMDYGPLLGGPPGGGTVAGMLAANLSGPRRLKAGAARDHVLGISAVSGRGEAFKSGGRVVKNVTGYDLSKGLAGSWGTLAVLTDVTFKVLPKAETETTLALRGLSDASAAGAMALAMGSAAEVSSAAHLPENVAPRADAALAGASATLLRLEGVAPSVTSRLGQLAQTLGTFPDHELLQGDASARVWQAIRDCRPFADGGERPVWRVSVAPAAGPTLVDLLRREAAADAFYDWQGGLVWLRMDFDPEADLVRRLVRQAGGGHATLVRAAPQWRAAIPVFEPQAEALAALAARLKHEFDPHGVLNPGRMVLASPPASAERD